MIGPLQGDALGGTCGSHVIFRGGDVGFSHRTTSKLTIQRISLSMFMFSKTSNFALLFHVPHTHVALEFHSRPNGHFNHASSYEKEDNREERFGSQEIEKEFERRAE